MRFRIPITFLVIANLFIFINRNNGFRYESIETQLKIYNTDSTFFLKDLTIKNGVAYLDFSRNLSRSNYKINIDSNQINGKTLYIEGSKAKFSLLPGKHNYAFQSGIESFPDFIIVLDYYNGMHVEAELLYCSLSGPGNEFTPIQVWKNGRKDFTSSDLEKARLFLENLPGWNNGSSDISKVMAISTFCAGICHQQGACKFPENLKQFSIFSHYNDGDCQTRFNCGSYTLSFQFFCTAAGIPVRSIIVGETENKGWQYAVHYFNEVYLKEANKWAFFDGLANLILPHDGKGHYFNGIEVQQLANLRTIAPSIKAYFSNSDSLIEKELNDYHLHLNNYFRNNSMLYYPHPGYPLTKSFWRRVKEFYSFSNHSSVYSPLKKNNYVLIYLKLICFYSILLLVAIELYLKIRLYLLKYRNKVS